MEERNGVVHLAELMEEQNEENEQDKKQSKDEAGESSSAESAKAETNAEEEDKPTPQQLEALLILADLVLLTSSPS